MAQLDDLRAARENVASLERQVAVLDSQRERAAAEHHKTLALAAKELGLESITMSELEARITEMQTELAAEAEVFNTKVNEIRAAIEEGTT